MVDSKNAVIEGTIFWPFFDRQNPMKAGKYTVDLGNLDKAAVKTLKDMGLDHKVKVDEPRDGYTVSEDGETFVSEGPDKRDKPNRHTYVQCQSGYKPKVFDMGKNTVDPSIVGNGSVANVRVTAYPWTFKGEKGLGAGFNAVQISTLKAFHGGDALSDFSFDASASDIESTGDDNVDFEE